MRHAKRCWVVGAVFTLVSAGVALAPSCGSSAGGQPNPRLHAAARTVTVHAPQASHSGALLLGSLALIQVKRSIRINRLPRHRHAAA